MGTSDVNTLVNTGIQVATVLGASISFLWGRFEWTHRRVKRDLKKCEDRHAVAQERRAVMSIAIELLFQEVLRVHPDSPTIHRVRRILDRLDTINGRSGTGELPETFDRD